MKNDPTGRTKNRWFLHQSLLLPQSLHLPNVGDQAQVDLPVPTETDETAEEVISCWGEGRYEDGTSMKKRPKNT